MSTPENIEITSALDALPDERDVYASEILAGDMASLPTSYHLPIQYISNQGQTPDCTAHGQAGVVNEDNGLAGTNSSNMADVKTIDPIKLGEYGHQIGAIGPNGGFINWAFSYLKKNGWINGYVKVEDTVDAMKRAIFQYGALVTGSNKIPWGQFTAANGWIAPVGNGGGHCFRIDGWDDTRDGGVFRISNSWGEGWGDNGSFYIRYTDLSLLFSKFVFINANDTQKLLGLVAMKKGYWNAKYGERVSSRWEVAMMISRFLGISMQATIGMIWNGERPHEDVTMDELRIMFERVNKQKTIRNIPTDCTRLGVVISL